MNQFKVEIPDLEDAIMSALQPTIDAALSAAEIVRQTIKDLVILGNIDVDGGQFQKKKPRPKRSPKNEPNFAVLDTGNMMASERWTLLEITQNTATVQYDPPDYFDHLIEKSPEQGGRKWMTRDRINDDTRGIIEEEMAARARAAQ